MADTVYEAKSGFYDSVNHDRVYFADDMNRPYRRLVCNGVFASQDGTPSTDLQVVQTESPTMAVVVKAGEGIFGYKWFENTSDISIAVPTNVSTMNRCDSIIARVDTRNEARKATIVLRTGFLNADGFVHPNLENTDGVFEYRIADIYVRSGQSEIKQRDIADKRGSAECPWVTGLIQQVDTSTLYDQWNDAFQGFYDREIGRVAQFVKTLTEELKVEMSMVRFKRHHVTEHPVSELPVGIDGFDENTDLLDVYINGMHAVCGERYTMSEDGQTIIFIPDVSADQRIDLVVLKGIAGADSAEAMVLLSEIGSKVAEIDSRTQTVEWQNVPTSYTVGVRPQVKRHGDVVYLTGSVSGTMSTGSVLCTLPDGFRPQIGHTYAAPTDSGEFVGISILPTGEVKVASGTVTDSMVHFSTTFMR